MRTKRVFLFFASIMAFAEVTAQLSLPRIDIESKLTQNIVPGNQGDNNAYPLKALETTNLQLGVHWQIKQYLALGWIYSGSLRGSGYNGTDFKFNFGKGDSKALTSFSGIDLRLSTGRANRWRPYLSLSYGKAEVVEDRGSFRLASKTNAFGGSLGIMRRMGTHLYWNVLEASVKIFSKKMFWADDGGVMMELKTGFTYNIGKKK